MRLYGFINKKQIVIVWLFECHWLVLDTVNANNSFYQFIQSLEAPIYQKVVYFWLKYVLLVRKEDPS